VSEDMRQTNNAISRRIDWHGCGANRNRAPSPAGTQRGYGYTLTIGTLIDVTMSGLENRRVLITGAARGIGAALARRLHSRGARVALAGLEPDLLRDVAADCGDAPWQACDVRDAQATEQAVTTLVDALDGLD